nr:hypothetical protein [Nitrosomonas nitrosa]
MLKPSVEIPPAIATSPLEPIMNWRGLRAQPFGHTIASAAACPPVRPAHQPQTSRPASDA